MICNALASLLFMLTTPQSTMALYFLMAFSGFAAIGIWVTQMSAGADVIEWDEERTGQRQEGAYAGITSMSIKIATGVSLLLVGPILSWVGYKPGAIGITTQAAGNLRMLFALRPGSIYLLSALVFSRYPITPATHRPRRAAL